MMFCRASISRDSTVNKKEKWNGDHTPTPATRTLVSCTDPVWSLSERTALSCRSQTRLVAAGSVLLHNGRSVEHRSKKKLMLVALSYKLSILYTTSVVQLTLLLGFYSDKEWLLKMWLTSNIFLVISFPSKTCSIFSKDFSLDSSRLYSWGAPLIEDITLNKKIGKDKPFKNAYSGRNRKKNLKK